MPIHFPANLEGGLRVAREGKLFDRVPEDVIRRQMELLRERARG